MAGGLGRDRLGWCVLTAFAFIAIPHFEKAVNDWLFDSPMALFELAVGGWLLFKRVRSNLAGAPLSAAP